MSTFTRLNQVYKVSENIEFDDTSRLIFFSDCHRGDNSWADNFARNRSLFRHTLEHYYREGYTYIEIGDGDELWENRSFSDIFNAHRDTFLLMQKFHHEGRFYMLWGNHDIIKKNRRFVEKNLCKCKNRYFSKGEPLFDGIHPHEGLVLTHKETSGKIFVVHGHQGDLINDRYWPLARFLVRYFWRPLELLGFRNPSSPAVNNIKTLSIERKLIDWLQVNNCALMAGHTHQPRFPTGREPRYLNTGCCVRPGYITGIEISRGEVSLVKWRINPSAGSTLKVEKEILSGPLKLRDLFAGLS